jgi:transposase-like protein
LGKELTSLRRTTAVLNITTEPLRSEADGEKETQEKTSLKQCVLEKLRTWVNSLLEAERDVFLGRGRHQPLDKEHANYRNGYRPR